MAFELNEIKKIIDIKGFYSFFYFEHGKNFCFSGERHDFWEMVYVDKGEISVVAENTGYLLSQGDVIFHKPMEFHAFTSAGGNPHNVMVTSFECKSPAMSYFANKIFSLLGHHKKILSLFLEEMFGWKEGKTDAFQLGGLHLEQFLIMLLREKPTLEKGEKESGRAKKNIENAFVDSIKDYLSENVYKNLSLMDICAHYNMSKSYLSRLFKNETGRGIIDYYIELKISEAKLLIRKEELNFTQIADKLGYGSIHHFTRSFKDRTGMSPSVYEKSVIK